MFATMYKMKGIHQAIFNLMTVGFKECEINYFEDAKSIYD